MTVLFIRENVDNYGWPLTYNISELKIINKLETFDNVGFHGQKSKYRREAK